MLFGINSSKKNTAFHKDSNTNNKLSQKILRNRTNFNKPAAVYIEYPKDAFDNKTYEKKEKNRLPLKVFLAIGGTIALILANRKNVFKIEDQKAKKPIAKFIKKPLGKIADFIDAKVYSKIEKQVKKLKNIGDEKMNKIQNKNKK